MLEIVCQPIQGVTQWHDFWDVMHGTNTRADDMENSGKGVIPTDSTHMHWVTLPSTVGSEINIADVSLLP